MLTQYISDKDLEKYLKKYNEVEFRFGFFDDKTFKPEVSKQIFHKIEKICKQYYKYTVVEEEIKRFSHPKFKYRMNIKTGEITIKRNIKNIDIHSYGIRLSCCNEEIVNDVDVSSLPFVSILKNRTSFDVGIGKLDMTQFIINSKISYQIEFEIKTIEYSNLLCFILQHLQKCYYLTQEGEKNIINAYIDKILKPRNNLSSVITNVKTLQKYNIGLISKDYAVTNKLDGERCILLIYDNVIYIIETNTRHFYKTDLTCNFKNFILDGELVIRGDFYEFHIFDIIYHNDRNLSDNKDFNLHSRLKLIYQLDIQNGNFFKIINKKYYFDNVFIASKKILKYDNEKGDGLVFIPINECYKNQNLYKWKPVHLNTIDFFSIKKQNNVWELYVRGINNIKKFDNVFVHNDKYKEDCIKTIGYTIFDDTFKDPTTLLPYETNTVIEFYWNVELSKFLPIRTRWDKTYSDKNGGNFESVAYDIWYNINNPITEDFLTNYVKKSVNNLYINYEKSLRECKSSIFTNKKNYVILNKECEKDPYVLKSENNDKMYSNIISHNIENFFSSESLFNNLLDILKVCLRKNGLFLFSYINEKELEKLSTIKEEDNKILYIKEIYKQDCEYGNKFVINCNNFTINENIINIEHMIEKFEKEGFKLEYNQPHKTKNKMSEHECDLFSIHYHACFKKINDVKIKKIKNTNNEIIPSFDQIQEYRKIKINTSYDLLNFLNCIEYKFNNFIHENFDITNLSHINNVFELYNIEYPLNFVNKIEEYKQGCINFLLEDEHVYMCLFYEMILLNFQKL